MRYFIFLILISTACFSQTKHREKLLDIVAGEWIAQSVYTATKLNVADHLLSGPKSVEHLASLTNSDEENLYRLLRLLSSVGIFKEGANKSFGNTETSVMLSHNHPQSLRHLILFYSREMSKSFSHLDGCIQKGVPAFELTFQKPVFEYFRDHQNSSDLFNAAMREKSRLVIQSCLSMYDFGKYTTVYDIGGGTGLFLQALLAKFPNMRGLLLDVPSVVSQAKSELEPYVKRCGFVAGDFFSEIPSDGEAYLLKSVIHDWDDGSALKILRKCYGAMRREAKLLIVEPILETTEGKNYAKCMDVLMMAVTGGKERTEEDYRFLLKEAGFKVDSITHTDTEFAIIQASKQ